MNRSRHLSVARSAVGRLVSKTNGFARVATSGTRSTREEYALPACISGLKRSASLAVDGRRIPTGMRTEQTSMTGRTHFAIKERPQDPLSHPCRDGHKHGVSEAFLNCSQKASGFVSTCLGNEAGCENSI